MFCTSVSEAIPFKGMKNWGRSGIPTTVTTILKSGCRNVKSVKKAKIHRPRTPWKNAKYPVGRGKLLELICFHWRGMNTYSCVTITPNFPQSRRYKVDNPWDKWLSSLQSAWCLNTVVINFWQWPPVWLSQLQAVLRRMGFSAHNFEPEIPTIQWVHWTSSDCQKHFRQG